MVYLAEMACLFEPIHVNFEISLAKILLHFCIVCYYLITSKIV